MARRKQRLSVMDLVALKPGQGFVKGKETTVEQRPVPERETLASFTAKLQREEEAKLLAPINETLRQIVRTKAAMWKTPLAQIQRYEVDTLYLDLALPQTERAISDGELRTAVRTFVTETLTPTSGFTLDQSGAMRLFAFCYAQHFGGKVEVNEQTIRACFDWLKDHDCFADTELGFDPTLRTVEVTQAPEQEKSLHDLLVTADTANSRNDDAALKQAARAEFLRGAGAIWQQWRDSLAANFGHYITKAEDDAAFNYFKTTNLSPHDPRSYDRCRIALCKSGVFNPAEMLTAKEALEQLYESGAISFGEYRRKEQFFSAQGLLSQARSRAGI